MTQKEAKKSNLPKMPKPFKIILLSLAGIFVFLIVLAIVFPPSNKDIEEEARQKAREKSQSMIAESSDGVAITGMRAAIAQQELNSGGIFTEKTCNDLKNAVLRFNSGADWFNNCYGEFFVSLADTSNKGVMKIADGKNCAIITTNKETHKIEDYSFKNEHCRGVRAAFVSEKN